MSSVLRAILLAVSCVIVTGTAWQTLPGQQQQNAAQTPEFVNSHRAKVPLGQRYSSTNSAGVRVESDVPQLFLRGENDTGYSTPGSKLPAKNPTRSGVTLRVTSWSFSPDGKWIAIGWAGHKPGNRRGLDMNEGALEVWDVLTGQLVKRLKFFPAEVPGVGPITAVSFSEDGKKVIYEGSEFTPDGV